MRSTVVVMIGLLMACGDKHGDAGVDANSPCLGPTDCPQGAFCSANQTCVAEGSCAVAADCGAGMTCNAAGTCERGGCGGTTLDLTQIPPNFMIALDRSCSMRENLANTTTSKWEAAVAALGHVLGTYPDQIRWGLTMFPDITGEACTQDASAFPIADHNAGPIGALLTAALSSADPMYPDSPCVTNIDTGITRAAADPALITPGQTSFMLLVSDGAQGGCTGGGGNAAVKEVLSDLHDNRGVKTFVVGFGSQVDAVHLNQFATSGGTALPGATKYYKADTASQLDAVFQTIANLVVSCEYEVNPAPTDLDQTYVYFSHTELIARDPTHAGGWDYDPATLKLTLYGSDCDRLKSHAVTDIDVIFGCPTPPIQ